MQKEHVSLSLEDDLLAKIDALSKQEHKDRSALISELLDRALDPAPPSGPLPPPGEVPPILQSRLDSLAQWRRQCAAEAAKRQTNFWLLTIPPLAVNAGYGCGLFNKLHLAALQPFALFVSTMLMLVEKERPQERLYTALEKAALELEQLLRAMLEQWQAGSAAGQDPRLLLTQILSLAEKEEARISKFLADAESYLKEASLSRRFKSAGAKVLASLRAG